MKKQLLISLITAVFYMVSSVAQQPPTQGPLRISQFNVVPSPCGAVDDETATIDIVAAGGVPPYTYQVSVAGVTSPPQTSSTFIVNVPPTLTGTRPLFTVRDSAGAVFAAQQITAGPSAFAAYSITFIEPTCFGGTDGSILLTVTGGVDPITYTVNGIVQIGNGLFTNQIAGPKTILIEDAVANPNCQTFAALNLTQPAAIAVDDITSIAPTCTGGTNGTATFTITGGTSPYVACLTNVTSGTPVTCTIVDGLGLFQNLTNANYSLTVTDTNGCTLATPATITVPAPNAIVLNVTTTSTCSTSVSGTITVTATGTTGAVTYIISGPVAEKNTTGIFTGLPAGTYQVTVSDSAVPADCALATTVVGTAGAISFTAPTLTSPACFNSADGSILLIASQVTGGTGTLTYSIGTGAGFIAVGTPFTGLSAGTYTVTVKDSTGCLSQPQTFTLTAPGQITFTFSTRQPNCSGTSTGAIIVDTLTTEGGNPGTTGYSYSIDGVDFSNTSGVFDSLPAGSYTLTAFDGGNCFSQSQSVVLPDPEQLGISYTLTPATVPTCNGSSTLTIQQVLGGFTPVIGNVAQPQAYSFKVDNGEFLPAGGTTTFPFVFPTALTEGSHTLTAQATNGCKSPTVEVIVNASSITFTAPTVVNETCFNGKTGSITLAVSQISGGTAPYTYSIGTVDGFIAAGGTFSNLAAGSYMVTVKDFNTCQSEPQEVVIHQPNEITFNVAVTKEISCPGGANGVITVSNAQGGSGTGFEYSKGGTAATDFQTPAVFSNLRAGTYTITVRDSSGTCLSRTQDVVLQDPQQMGVVYTTTPASCQANGTVTNGSVIIQSVLDGLPPYKFAVDSVNFLPDGGVSTFPFTVPTALSAGLHSLTVQDANLCLSPTVKVNVPAPEPIVVNYIVSDVTINAASDGSITVTRPVNASGETRFSYSLDGVNFQGSNVFPNLMADVFELTVRDNLTGGCLTPTQEIVVNEPIRTRITGTITTHATVPSKIPNGSLCIETESTATLQYSIHGLEGPFQESPCFNGLAVGTYHLAVKPLVSVEGSVAPLLVPVPDGQGNTAVGIGVVTPVSPLVVTATVKPANCPLGSLGSITVHVTGGTPPFQYSLNGGPFQTSNIFTGLAAGTYIVTVLDADNHTSNISVTVPNAGIVSSNPITNFLLKFCPCPTA